MYSLIKFNFELTRRILVSWPWITFDDHLSVATCIRVLSLIKVGFSLDDGKYTIFHVYDRYMLHMVRSLLHARGFYVMLHTIKL